MLEDLPVGQNLEDHLFTDAGTFTVKEPVTITDDKVMSIQAQLQHMIFGTGMSLMIKTFFLTHLNRFF